MNSSRTATVRVRYAPSPTGRLHVGGARTALFNWAYARRSGGVFVLRVEDTDPGRSKIEYEREILDAMAWLGLDWDEGPDKGGPYGPYRQSERLERHRAIGEELVLKSHAYRCFCTAERLDVLRADQEVRRVKPAYDGRCRALSAAAAADRVRAGESAVVRFRVPEGETRFRDLVRGDVVFQNREVEDWIMLRADGGPTYNFVVVCDDADMRVSHVFRGEEHLVNTPKQVLLYQALGLSWPEFGHLPLMLGPDGKKLSKRTGDTALLDYRDKGYPRDAVVNFLCLQGWALDGKREIFSTSEFVERFDIRDVAKAGAVFDLAKFQWLAGEYIRRETPEHLAERCAPYVVAAGLMGQAELEERRSWFIDVVRGEQERIRTYSELPQRIAYLFAPDEQVPYDAQAVQGAQRHAGVLETLRQFRPWIAERLAVGAPAAKLREEAKLWVAGSGLKMPELFQPLRCVLTGQSGGPDLFDVIALLGPARALRRIDRGMERLGVPNVEGA